MKITKLSITHFRHIRDISFNIGPVLTVIAGGNGTGKTSLLGMLGHVFKYERGRKTLFRTPFETKYSQVFQFSPKHDSGAYAYRVDFDNQQQRKGELRVMTSKQNKTRHRIDVGERQRSFGKISLPVIFLSLKRVIPLAGESQQTITIKSASLSPRQIAEYNRMHNTIFATDSVLTPTETKSGNKRLIAPTTANFDAYGMSAGQDNVGTILQALLSFEELKNTAPTYDGGLLLIDEVEATLHPAAQKNLLQVLLEKGKTLKLQVVFTTHSSDILNFLNSDRNGSFKNSTEFVSLSASRGKVNVVQGFAALKQALAQLNHEVLEPLKPTKINVYTEDNEALLFHKALLKGKAMNVELNYKPNSVGCSVYISLIRGGFEEFDRSIMVLDGDAKNESADSQKAVVESDDNTIVFLPGNERPENIINDFLRELPADDPFWDNAILYDKTVYLQNAPRPGSDTGGSSDERKTKDREVMKKWWKSELSKWGTDGERVFKRWQEKNSVEAARIVSRTRVVADRIRDNYFKNSSHQA